MHNCTQLHCVIFARNFSGDNPFKSLDQNSEAQFPTSQQPSLVHNTTRELASDGNLLALSSQWKHRIVYIEIIWIVTFEYGPTSCMKIALVQEGEARVKWTVFYSPSFVGVINPSSDVSLTCRRTGILLGTRTIGWWGGWWNNNKQTRAKH